MDFIRFHKICFNQMSFFKEMEHGEQTAFINRREIQNNQKK